LVRLLLGDLEPTEGSLRLGTNLQVAYFDQLRGELDLERTALDNIAEGREYIDINGQQKHVMGYLQEFLFSPQRARSPVSVFSGGERARLLLAKLFSKPANILVLDEPTNDLDVETLELLEARLVEFSGTVILISHDREFLDNVVTDTIFLDGTGKVREYVGGYSDWRRQGGRFPAETGGIRKAGNRGAPSGSMPADSGQMKPAADKTDAGDKAAGSPEKKQGKAKLSYKLKLELEQLPGMIESLENRLAELQEKVSDSDFYAGDQGEVTATLEAMAAAEAELEQTLERWMELEEMGAG
jgi:ATP-binding cassette subfamily F protein uup